MDDIRPVTAVSGQEIEFRPEHIPLFAGNALDIPFFEQCFQNVADGAFGNLHLFADGGRGDGTASGIGEDPQQLQGFLYGVRHGITAFFQCDFSIISLFVFVNRVLKFHSVKLRISYCEIC